MLYFYDNILVILFSGVCLLAFCSCLRKRNKTSAYIAGLFFCLLLNQLATSMVEFLPEFARIYDTFYVTMPIFNTINAISIAVCLLSLSYECVPDRPIPSYEYFILAGFGLLLLLVPTLANTLFHLFLYSSALLFYLLYRGIWFCFLIHQKIPKSLHAHNPGMIHILSFIAPLLLLLGLTENYVNIFDLCSHGGTYSYRIFSFDFLFGLISVFCIRAYAQKETAPQTCEAQIPSLSSIITESRSSISPGTEIGIFHTFCSAYSLTLREQTILAELLHHATYQQISDKLLISSFTVKSHVHHICKKTGVISKQNICEFYERYKNSLPDDDIHSLPSS